MIFAVCPTHPTGCNGWPNRVPQKVPHLAIGGGTVGSYADLWPDAGIAYLQVADAHYRQNGREAVRGIWIKRRSMNRYPTTSGRLANGVSGGLPAFRSTQEL